MQGPSSLAVGTLGTSQALRGCVRATSARTCLQRACSADGFLLKQRRFCRSLPGGSVGCVSREETQKREVSLAAARPPRSPKADKDDGEICASVTDSRAEAASGGRCEAP